MVEDNNSWELKTINKMLEMTVKEQRARRRWGVFFRLTILAYVLIVTVMIFLQRSDVALPTTKPSTAVIDIKGAIMPDGDSSAQNIVPLLRKAFEQPMTKGVLLRINSPGGSAVQSNQIYNELQILRKKYPDTKVYAVIEDIGASGAYWIACGADEIYADKASIVGSIGAVISSFGFVDAMEKLGVQRRLYASGANKAMLDPFSPQTPEQIAILNHEIKLMLELFEGLVKESRGDRLKVTHDMFSGRIWIGMEALQLGLIDGFGDPNYVASEVIGAKNMVEYAPKKSLLGQITKQFGQSLSIQSWLKTTVAADIS